MARRVIVEMHPAARLIAAAALVASPDADGGGGPGRRPRRASFGAASEAAVEAIQQLPGFLPDPRFPPTPVPDPTAVVETLTAGTDARRVSFSAARDGKTAYDVQPRVSVSTDPQVTPYVIRGEIPDDDQVEALAADPRVRAVYADPVIAPCPPPPLPMVCPGAPAAGTDRDVARLLGARGLAAAGMDGRGVFVAIVDTGINLAHLRARGKDPRTDPERSWTAPDVATTPFEFPVDHGTMCAYDALIAAPRATLLDIAVLRPASLESLLSDAVLAYSHLLSLLQAQGGAGTSPLSLVVSNSWAIFDPAWDFPVGHAGNYTANPEHPFNRIVTTLESFGADILFAAGNCGADCPDGRCRWPQGASTIAGANGHPSVLSVAGVDVRGERVGYSSTGPAHLSDRKPDLAGFTHFEGSGVDAVDGGTSAACPVVAGVVAAVRSRMPTVVGDGPASPAAVRDMLRKTALERGNPGFDFAYGWGIINGHRLSQIVPDHTTAASPDETAEAVSRLEAELLGTPPAPAPVAGAAGSGRVSLTASPGVKTLTARVTSQLSIKDTSIQLPGEFPSQLTGGARDKSVKGLKTDEFGVLTFDFVVHSDFVGTCLFTLVNEASGSTVHSKSLSMNDGGAVYTHTVTI